MRWLRNLQSNSIPNRHGKLAVGMLHIVVVVVSMTTDLAGCELGRHRKNEQSEIFLEKRVDCLPI